MENFENRSESELNIDFQNLSDKNSKEELNKLKKWLFQENVRIQQENVKLQHEHIKVQEKKNKLAEEELFLQKRLDILKNAYLQLDVDRKKLEKEKLLIQARKDRLSKVEENIFFDNYTVYFRGVNSLLSLKKRYKDLIKIFHPDNLCGDTETIQKINKEYESLRKVFDFTRQA